MMNPCGAVENLEDRADQSNSRPTQAASNQQSNRLLMFKGDAGVCEKKLGASVLYRERAFDGLPCGSRGSIGTVEVFV